MKESFFDIEGIKGEYLFNFFSCSTRLWLSSRNIIGFVENKHMQIGKHIDETSFKREVQSISIDGMISLDFVRKGDALEIHEVKKGKSFSEPQEMQVMYYMYVMNAILGYVPKSYLHLVQARKTKEIHLDSKKVEDSIRSIRAVLSEECPKPQRKPICRGCSYSIVCWS